MQKYLLISLLIFLSLQAKSQVLDKCESLKLSIERSEEQVTAIAVNGGISPIYYIFFYPDGRFVDKNRDLKSGSIKNFSKGKYICAVTDESGCTKKIEFEIE